MEKKEEFIRVGTTLYKIVNQPRIDGGYVRKRIAWNSETLRQDYGKDYMAGIPKYDGFCTVPDHVGYQPVVGKFLNLYEPISHVPVQGDFPCIRLLGDTLLLGDCLEHIFLNTSVLSACINNSTLFHSQQVRRGSNRGEHRHPQAGRTDFHPADQQGKADVAGEKKNSKDTHRQHRRYRRRLLGTKSHSSLGRFLHAPLTLMLKTPQ